MLYLCSRVVAWKAYLTFAKLCSSYNFVQGTLPEGFPDPLFIKAHEEKQVLQNFEGLSPGPKGGNLLKVLSLSIDSVYEG
jgi:hypothetical protein